MVYTIDGNVNVTRRKRITITGAVSGAQTDFQIKLAALAYAAAMQSDFDDLRFCKADMQTRIDAWLEDKTDDTSADVWIEAPTTPANGDKETYWLYFGNDGAASDWDFDSTFIFGDPFDDASLDTGRWTSVDGGPTYSFDAVNHYLEVTDMDANNWRNGKGFHSKTLSFPSEWITEDAYSSDGYRQYQESNSNAILMEVLLSITDGAWSGTNLGSAFIQTYDAHAASAYTVCRVGVGDVVDYATSHLSTPHSYYTKIFKTSGNIHIDLDGTERANKANSDTINVIHLGISRHTTDPFGTARFYAFKVRKYAANPPTASIGTEEHQRRTPQFM